MTNTLRVATRKGLFIFERHSVSQWKMTRSAFVGDPVTAVMVDPCNGDQYAALNLGHFGVKLHRASRNSDDWQEVATPKFPSDKNDGNNVSLEQLWVLSAADSVSEGHLWAGTIPGGLFKSEDRGESWVLNESLWNRPERKEWMGGGFDQPGIHSICVDPRDSRRVLLAVSCGGIWETLNEGQSWQQVGQGLRAAYVPEQLAYQLTTQDPHSLKVCASSPEHAWIQHHNGIFRSSDAGRTWNEVKDVVPSVFGFAVAVHPLDPNTAWFIPGVKDECRIPVDAQLVVTRTRDGGSSFEVLSNGLPTENAYDVIYRHALDIDSSGQQLAFGSTTGNLWFSENQGDQWQNISCNLPPIYAVQFD